MLNCFISIIIWKRTFDLLIWKTSILFWNLTVNINQILNLKGELLFIPTVGLQETTYYAIGRKQVTFHAFKRLETSSLIINENVSMFRTTTYLCLIDKQSKVGKASLIPLLCEIKPKLDILRLVYSNLRCFNDTFFISEWIDLFFEQLKMLTCKFK